jgi:hypothetical protein
VKDGDELKATIHISYQPAVAKAPAKQKDNIPPHANAGLFLEVELPVKDPVVLNGAKSYDSDGRLVSAKWKQIEGPNSLSLTTADSSISTVKGDFRAGVYAFELTVEDDAGEMAKDRIVMRVKPAAASTLPLTRTEPVRKDTSSVLKPVIIKEPVLVQTKKDSAVVRPPVVKAEIPPQVKKDTAVTTKPIARSEIPVQIRKDTNVNRPTVPAVTRNYTMPKLKGGPRNGLVNLLVPGLGHYFVSGDHHGEYRKPTAFIITALYAGSIGGAAYYQLRSVDEYKKYNELADFREYQRDASGNIIGVRGYSEAKAGQYLKDAKSSRRNALILTGISAGIITADLIYTVMKGFRNQRMWKQEGGVKAKPFFASDGTSLVAGLRINFK